MRRKISVVLAIVAIILVLTGCGKNYPITLDDQFYGDGKFIGVSGSDLSELEDSESNYVVYTYNENCTLVIPFREVLLKYMEEYKISVYSIAYSDFRDTFLHEDVKYAPTVIIVSNGKVIDYLDAESDEDYDRYQDVDKLTEWMNTYINIEEE